MVVREASAGGHPPVVAVALGLLRLLREEVVRVRHQQSGAENRLKRLSLLSDDASGEIHVLEQQLTALNQREAASASTIRSLQQDVARLEEQLGDKDVELQAFRSRGLGASKAARFQAASSPGGDCDSCLGNEADDDGSVDKATQQLEALQADFLTLRGELDEARESRTEAEQLLGDFQRRLGETDVALQGERARNEVLEEKLRMLEQANCVHGLMSSPRGGDSGTDVCLAMAAAAEAAANERCAVAEAELQHLEVERDELLKVKVDLEAHGALLLREREASAAHAAEVEAACSAAQVAAAKTSAKAQDTGRALQQARVEMQDLRAEVASLQERLADAADNNEALSLTVFAERRRMEGVRVTHESLQQRLQHGAEQLEHTLAELGQQRAESKRLRGDLSVSKEACDQVSRAYERLHEEMSQIRARANQEVEECTRALLQTDASTQTQIRDICSARAAQGSWSPVASVQTQLHPTGAAQLPAPPLAPRQALHQQSAPTLAVRQVSRPQTLALQQPATPSTVSRQVLVGTALQGTLPPPPRSPAPQQPAPPPPCPTQHSSARPRSPTKPPQRVSSRSPCYSPKRQEGSKSVRSPTTAPTKARGDASISRVASVSNRRQAQAGQAGAKKTQICRFCCQERDSDEHLLLRCSFHSTGRSDLAKACDNLAGGSWSAASGDKERMNLLMRDARVQHSLNDFVNKATRDRDSAALTGEVQLPNNRGLGEVYDYEDYAARRGGS